MAYSFAPGSSPQSIKCNLLEGLDKQVQRVHSWLPKQALKSSTHAVPCTSRHPSQGCTTLPGRMSLLHPISLVSDEGVKQHQSLH